MRKDRGQGREKLSTSVLLQNLCQNAEMFFNLTQVVPTLLQRSFLYDMVAEREVLAVEHLLMQGFPVPGLCSEDLSSSFPWPRILRLEPGIAMVETRGNCTQPTLTEAQLRSLAGIGFHWAQVGAFITFVFITSTHQVVKVA